MTKVIKKSVVVQVPVSAAYSQWTQFEEYPRFMGGVKEVKRLDNNQLRWIAKIAGELREWQAEVTELVPNTKVAWVATEGPKNAAVVTLSEISKGQTKVHFEYEYDLGAFGADEEDELVVLSGLIEGDLERFAALVESESGTEAMPLPFAPVCLQAPRNGCLTQDLWLHYLWATPAAPAPTAASSAWVIAGTSEKTRDSARACRLAKARSRSGKNA